MDGLGNFKSFWDKSLKSDLDKISSSLKSLSTSGKSKKEASTEQTPNTKTRQQQPGGFTRSTHLVPISHQVNPKLNAKIERLRSQPDMSDIKIELDPEDLSYIKSVYKITELGPGSPKVLGNSNMMCSVCPHTGKPILHKRK